MLIVQVWEFSLRRAVARAFSLVFLRIVALRSDSDLRNYAALDEFPQIPRLQLVSCSRQPYYD